MIDPESNMETSTGTSPATPRIERSPSLRIAGLAEDYSFDTADKIQAQWRRFAPHIGNIPGQVGQTAYGVMSPLPREEGDFRYLAGVEVAGEPGLPAGFVRLDIPAGGYAVFEHHGPVAGIRDTWASVWNRWLPQSGHEAVDSPLLFERYGDAFDPETAQGVVELWVPIKEAA